MKSAPPESANTRERTYALLRTALYFGLAHRWSVVLAMLALLGLSIFGYGYMRQGFFPDMVYDQLYMEYKLPRRQ